MLNSKNSNNNNNKSRRVVATSPKVIVTLAAVLACGLATLSRLKVPLTQVLVVVDRATGIGTNDPVKLHNRSSSSSSSKRHCVLLFGAFANGNLGDVAQPESVIRHLHKIDPELCVWTSSKYYPLDAETHVGQMLADPQRHAGDLDCNIESAQIVNQFGALLIGGGGLFSAHHQPLECPAFVDNLRPDLPIGILPVGANCRDCLQAARPLLQRALFVAIRESYDIQIVTQEAPKETQGKVLKLPDPILADYDSQNKKNTSMCQSWKPDNPTCFVIPSSRNKYKEAHGSIQSWASPKDKIINVFPKHGVKIQKHYPNASIINLFTPQDYKTLICDCGAIVSWRYHGVIFGLTQGIPSMGMELEDSGKIYSLSHEWLETGADLWLTFSTNLTRSQMEAKVAELKRNYALSLREKVAQKLDSFGNQIHELLKKHQRALFPWLKPPSFSEFRGFVKHT